MPELPEVEVISRGVAPHLVGQRITQISGSGKPLRLPIDLQALQAGANGKKIEGVARRAKFIEIFLDHGAMIIIHLGMTGKLKIFSPDAPAEKHDHLLLTLGNNTQLRFNDSRRFGLIRFLSAEDAAARDTTIYAAVGPEPLNDAFSAEYLAGIARNKTVAVKILLMTNAVVAGIGNIYANEILFRAKIRPMRSANSISKREWQRIFLEIREVLREAIDCGGSTISDYVNANGKPGYFQMHFNVYGHAGAQCPRCTATILKQQLGGRASYYCPHCQK
jgi:formamidopyrimidine-DNA glycosylase